MKWSTSLVLTVVTKSCEGQHDIIPRSRGGRGVSLLQLSIVISIYMYLRIVLSLTCKSPHTPRSMLCQ